MKKRKKRRHARPLKVLLILAALALCVLFAPYTPYRLPDEGISVRFFDVGQGDAALVKCGNRAMLIDAGTPEGAWWLLARLYLSGVTRLDVAVATHPHDDHIGGMPLVLTLFSCDTLLLPEAVNNANDAYASMLRAAQARGCSVIHPNPGTHMTMNGAQVEILAPRSRYYQDMNDASIVLRVDYGQNRFLFTGDAEETSEWQMLNSDARLDADVLKIAHHGSRSSSTQDFLDAVFPRYAVISVGAQNEYGHPAQAVLNRLAQSGIQVLRTDLLGSVTFTGDGSTLAYASVR